MKIKYTSMKRLMLMAIVSVMLVNLNVLAKENVSSEVKAEFSQQSNTLKGIVADKTTQETLAGAIINVNGQKVYTDLDGNFSISNLCGGKCQLKVSLISYKDLIVEIDTNTDQSLKIKMEQR
jgi:hypothetical protein